MTDASTDNVVGLHSNVAKDLLDQVNALYALAKTHQLLSIGMFQASVFSEVEQAREFISILHSEALDKALLHPDADKIAKLVELKKQRGERDHGEGNGSPEKA